MTGAAREFIVQRLLQTFLPPSVFVGAGRVISAVEEPSGQSVLFDSRFPFIRDNDQCLFPVEWVIATVEVKSKIDKDSLRNSLDNALRIRRLPKGMISADVNRIQRQASLVGLPDDLLLKALGESVSPRTFILGLSGLATPGLLHAHVSEWFFENADPRAGHYPVLPHVIVAERSVGIAAEAIKLMSGEGVDAQGRRIDKGQAPDGVLGDRSPLRPPRLQCAGVDSASRAANVRRVIARRV
jgi:hypothetical protein